MHSMTTDSPTPQQWSDVVVSIIINFVQLKKKTAAMSGSSEVIILGIFRPKLELGGGNLALQVCTAIHQRHIIHLKKQLGFSLSLLIPSGRDPEIRRNR